MPKANLKQPSLQLQGNTPIFPAKGLRGNPRAPGTSGYQSFDLILKQPGIIYDIFRRAGGQRRDLLWDLDHKHVRLG